MNSFTAQALSRANVSIVRSSSCHNVYVADFVGSVQGNFAELVTSLRASGHLKPTDHGVAVVDVKMNGKTENVTLIAAPPPSSSADVVTRTVQGVACGAAQFFSRVIVAFQCTANGVHCHDLAQDGSPPDCISMTLSVNLGNFSSNSSFTIHPPPRSQPNLMDGPSPSTSPSPGPGGDNNGGGGGGNPAARRSDTVSTVPLVVPTAAYGGEPRNNTFTGEDSGMEGPLALEFDDDDGPDSSSDGDTDEAVGGDATGQVLAGTLDTPVVLPSTLLPTRMASAAAVGASAGAADPTSAPLVAAPTPTTTPTPGPGRPVVRGIRVAGTSDVILFTAVPRGALQDPFWSRFVRPRLV